MSVSSINTKDVYILLAKTLLQLHYTLINKKHNLCIRNNPKTYESLALKMDYFKLILYTYSDSFLHENYEYMGLITRNS